MLNNVVEYSQNKIHVTAVKNKQKEICSLLKYCKNLQKNKKLIGHKKQEETVRKGGVNPIFKITDFTYFKQEINDTLLKEPDNMPKKRY